MNKIISNRSIKFKVTETDLTGDYSFITVTNIELHLSKRVRQFLGSTFIVSDLQEIIHIVDTDGAFIDNDNVVSKLYGDIEYQDEQILTKHKDKIERRNALKSAVLSHLSSINKLEVQKDYYVPYSIYFMSCNLDHVLHDERNLESNKKTSYATEFSDSFYNRENDFIDFMQDSKIALGGNYSDTWNEIQKDFLSLSRGSNFNLYLAKFKPKS
ncbi:hypothetical protein JN09_000363 [Acholeplasma morum]|uniref:hypothetical protein n=1 Tax=Paracholeplasma morum TaxID=264637 RepID=UPI001956F6CE|nr:hypothetical protein [Paracholeplasma morum]MBM7453044.1 hypothetical protein [Paracholeplasma morum]